MATLGQEMEASCGSRQSNKVGGWGPILESYSALARLRSPRGCVKTNTPLLTIPAASTAAY